MHSTHKLFSNKLLCRNPPHPPPSPKKENWPFNFSRCYAMIVKEM